MSIQDLRARQEQLTRQARQHENKAHTAHCWHTGSGMDSASYSQTEIHSTTHYMCCHCGQTKTETEHHKFSPIKDTARHGPHSWYTLKHESAKTTQAGDTETTGSL